MSKKIYITINDEEIILPVDYSVNDRNIFCQQLIDTYPDAFHYTLPQSANDQHGEKVSRRLEIMAQYILNGGQVSMNDGIVTEWANRKIRTNEVNFCDISDEFEEFS